MMKLEEKFLTIFDRIEQDFDEMTAFIESVEVMSDHKLYNHYLSKIKRIEDIALTFKEFKVCEGDYNAFLELRTQGEKNCDDEISALETRQNDLINKLKDLLSRQKSLEPEKVVIEITSKDDCEFVEEISIVFERYCGYVGFELEKQTKSSGEIILTINGVGVYSQLTIFSGKFKKILRGNETSCIVVVINQPITSTEIKDEDFIIQTSKSSGAGGQHINKTESAIRITHIPTGLTVECQDERSQTKNKEKAWNLILKKIAQKEENKNKNYEKKQRNELKNKIFSQTPVVVFDFDLNKVFFNEGKAEYRLKEILNGELGLIINNVVE